MSGQPQPDLPAPAAPRIGLPLEVFPAGAEPLSPLRQAQWLWAFMAIALAARLVRYLLRFPLWEDECLLSSNFLERGYLDLLRPLNYYQVAPALFLWCQLTVVKLLGFSEYTLRLVPFVCGIASLFLFRHLAGLLLRGTALVAAFGVFAVAYPPIRYTAEAKPYGCDLFLALVMLTLVVHWLRRPDQHRWLWGLAALIAPTVLFSYPAVFIAGGISLVVGYVLWSEGRRRGQPWSAWIVLNLLLAASFAAMLKLSYVAVGEVNQARMVGDWLDAFPPLAQPLQLPGWFISTHTGSMLAYPVGGPGGGSTLAFLCCAAGIGLLARRRQRLLLAVLLAPLGLNFIAAVLHRYPYGPHMRLSLYAAATVCVLMGLGIAALLHWAAGLRMILPSPSGRGAGGEGRSGFDFRLLPALPHPGPLPEGEGDLNATPDNPRLRRALGVVLVLLAAVAAGSILHDLVYPYKSTTTLRAREFARWFWFDLAHESELVCLETDMKANLSPGTYNWGWSALYLCNQRIYSLRHAAGKPPRWDRVSASWPLRCVLFRSSREERDNGALDRWLKDMQRSYQLVGRDCYPFPIYGKWDCPEQTIYNHVEVFKFIPLATAGKQQQPALRQTRHEAAVAR